MIGNSTSKIFSQDAGEVTWFKRFDPILGPHQFEKIMLQKPAGVFIHNNGGNWVKTFESGDFAIVLWKVLASGVSDHYNAAT